MTKASGTAEEQRAIAYLQWTGWLQDHDRQIYEQGKRDGIGERKVGRWISHIECGIYGSIQCWVCSECRELFSYDAETGVEITDYRFCPKCGAKMEGAEE